MAAIDFRTSLVESVTRSEDAALLTATEDRLVQQDATVISHRRTVSKSFILVTSGIGKQKQKGMFEAIGIVESVNLPPSRT